MSKAQERFLYNLKSLEQNKFQLAKFDADFNVAAVYNLLPARNGEFTCDCPANNRAVVLKRCKHRRMLPLMLGACNTDRFFDPETGNWLQPLGDLVRPEASDPAGREALVDQASQMLHQHNEIGEAALAAAGGQGEVGSEASEVVAEPDLTEAVEFLHRAEAVPARSAPAGIRRR